MADTTAPDLAAAILRKLRAEGCMSARAHTHGFQAITPLLEAALAAAQQPAKPGAPLQQQLAEMSEHANRLSDELQRLRAENEQLTRERDDLAAAGKLQRAQIRLLERERAAQQPAGYALVPLVPTPEMRRAGWKAVDGTKRIDCKIGAGSSAILYDRKADGADKADAAYRAMVAAAPAFTPGDSGAQTPAYQPVGQVPTGQPGAVLQQVLRALEHARDYIGTDEPQPAALCDVLAAIEALAGTTGAGQ